MSRIDELTSSFSVLALHEGIANRVDPAARPWASLEDSYAPTGVAQLDGCGKTGKAGTNDDHLTGRCSLGTRYSRTCQQVGTREGQSSGSGSCQCLPARTGCLSDFLGWHVSHLYPQRTRRFALDLPFIDLLRFRLDLFSDAT